MRLIENSPWDKDFVEELKDSYYAQRDDIVQSNLTIWDLRKVFEKDLLIELESGEDELSKILTDFLSKKRSKKIFLWELLD